MYAIIFTIISISSILYCAILVLRNQKLQKRHQQLTAIAKKIGQGTFDREYIGLETNDSGQQEFVEILNQIHRMLRRKDRALQKFKKIKKMEAHFLSVVRHQLRNPLTVIRWTLQTLRKDKNCTESPNNKMMLSESFKATEKMLELLDDFLGSAKISPYSIKLTRRKIILAKMINKSLAKYKHPIAESNLNVKIDYSPSDSLSVIGDKQLLYEAFRHIISNAISYTPDHGTITISLSPDRDTVLFTISDTGIGIKKDDSKKIYLKFYRGGNAIKMKPGSSGLGLYVASAIIKAHKGELWFENANDKGTVFYVRLRQK
jgi:two-component system phosphate regulon sensor histidine kinase PhoR